MINKAAQVKFSYVGLHVRSLTSACSVLCRDGLQLPLIECFEVTAQPLLEIKKSLRSLRAARIGFPETSAEIILIENPDAPVVDAHHVNPGTCHICFYTDDLQSTWSHLQVEGYELCSDGIIEIKGGVFDGGKCIYFIGPDGIRIELLEGRAYLDGRKRSATASLSNAHANEASHIGIHVRDRDRSLRFYRDLLGMHEIASWLECTTSTKKVIGLPTANLLMSILRLPGTQSFFEIIEYQETSGIPVDNSLTRNGVCHLGFNVTSIESWKTRLVERGCAYTEATDKLSLWCVDPDGFRIEIAEYRGILDGTIAPRTSGRSVERDQHNNLPWE